MRIATTTKSPPGVLTIDVEEWFHSLEPEPARWATLPRRVDVGVDWVLEALDRHGMSATFFVLADVALSSPSVVERIASAGHEIGSHGCEHRFVYRQTAAEFRSDVRRSLDVLGDLVGRPIVSYRAPYFSVVAGTTWAFDVLAEEGIQHDSSVYPVRNHRYGIPDFPRIPHAVRPGLFEWPLACLPTPVGNLPCAGGAYLRLLPWPVIASALGALRRRGDVVVAYLHPWEVDPDQPRVASGSWFLRWRHYHGLDSMAGKVESLLASMQFTSIAAARLAPSGGASP